MGSHRESSNRWVSGSLIVVLSLLIFFAPFYGWRLRNFLTSATGLNDGSGTSTSKNTQTDDQNLLAENETLKAQLAELQLVASQVPTQPQNDVRAMVYSRYPLNFKNELLVNAGSNEGVAQGDAVVFQGILVGQVKTVFSDSAIVQTFFDNGIKTPVRVGSSGYDGLLQGGAYPIIESITKEASVMPNDIVYSAAPGLPYGLPIGEISATSTSPDSLFEQATLSFSYDINTIETVLIVK